VVAAGGEIGGREGTAHGHSLQLKVHFKSR
jgi:hypothetical protein